MPRSIHIILPAYNEAESLAELLPSLVTTLKEEGLGYFIYVVDDGSTDETAKVVKKFSGKIRRILLIRHRQNRGLPEAINTGFRAAIEKCGEEDVVITMDADNTHLPGLIMRMVRLIREGHDVVVASRFTAGARVRGVPLVRRLLSLGASFTFRALFPTPGVRDYTSGYRAYSARIIKRALKEYGTSFVDRKGFSCMVDVLLKLRKLEAIITEVPMILRYDWKGGKSKMRVIETLIETWQLIGKYKLQEIRAAKQRWLWLGLGGLFLFSRTYRLRALPLFSDEAYAIDKAEVLNQTGDLLAMIKYTTQPIFIWLMALFQRIPINQIVSGRLVAGISGLVTAFVLARAAVKWIDPRAGVVAFGLATWLPFSLFYDRTVLFESTTLMFVSLAMFLPIVAVPLAILTKQIGWLALPLAVGLNLRNPKKLALIAFFGISIPFLTWWLALGEWSQVETIILKKSGAPLSGAADIKSNLLRSKLWLNIYLTKPIIALTLVGFGAGLIDGIKKKLWLDSLLIIAGWTAAVFLFENKVAGIFYPRYLFPLVLGVVLLATRGIWLLFGWIDNFGLKGIYRRLFQLLLLWLVLWPAVKFDRQLLTDPFETVLAAETRFQFFDDWTSGVGSEKLANEILRRSREDSVQTTVYLEERNSYYVTLRSDRRLDKLVKVRLASWLRDPLAEIPGEVIADRGQSFFVRNRNPDIPADWPVKKLWSLPKSTSREVALYQVVK